MYAFIDDSGDEGTDGSGSRWLVFGCVMLAEHDTASVRATVEEASIICGRGRPRWLHFRDLSHDDKHGALEYFKRSPWQGVIVATDTTQVLPGSRLRDPRSQYNYAARYVIERVSRYAVTLGEQASIYFESRRNFALNEFRMYIQRLINNRVPQIDRSVVSPDRIHEMAKGVDATLCIADGLAHAGYRALEPHRLWKRYERSYLEATVERLWRGPANEPNIHNWGFVLMPTSLWGTRFCVDYPWIRDLPQT